MLRGCGPVCTLRTQLYGFLPLTLRGQKRPLLETMMSPCVQLTAQNRDWLLLGSSRRALTVLLPGLDQADCGGLCGRAMLRNKWLEYTFCHCVGCCVLFKLQHTVEETRIFFLKATVFLPMGEMIIITKIYELALVRNFLSSDYLKGLYLRHKMISDGGWQDTQLFVFVKG